MGLLLQQCCGQFALLDQLAKFLLAIPGIDLMGVVVCFFIFLAHGIIHKEIQCHQTSQLIIRADSTPLPVT